MSGYHTPGLGDMIRGMDADRADKFQLMLEGFRHDMQRMCAGHEAEPTTLQKVVGALKYADVSDLREWKAIEDALIIEKHKIWTAKQIGREVKRTPYAVYNRMKKLGIHFKKDETF